MPCKRGSTSTVFEMREREKEIVGLAVSKLARLFATDTRAYVC